MIFDPCTDPNCPACNPKTGPQQAEANMPSGVGQTAPDDFTDRLAGKLDAIAEVLGVGSDRLSLFYDGSDCTMEIIVK